MKREKKETKKENFQVTKQKNRDRERPKREEKKTKLPLLLLFFLVRGGAWLFLGDFLCTLSFFVFLLRVVLKIRFCSLKKTFASEREERARRRTARRRTSSHRKELLLYIALYI